jgi:hypothetical protein
MERRKSEGAWIVERGGVDRRARTKDGRRGRMRRREGENEKKGVGKM